MSCGITETQRWCWRCVDCLSVVFVESQERSLLCGVCAGSMEPMGRVARNRVFDAERRCPCDVRCTSAQGPNCECSCGGANHGSNAVVEVIRDLGPIPTLGRPKCAADAIARAAEFRAAVGPVEAEHDALQEQRCRNRWLTDAEYGRLCSVGFLLRRVRKARIHKTRMRMLAEYAEKRRAVAV
jgi:hypothetical protein